MGKRKSMNKTPGSISHDNMLQTTETSSSIKSSNKTVTSKEPQTPKQTKNIPNIQSETKQVARKMNKKRKSLPANLTNGGSNDSKKPKIEPFSGTSDLFMQMKQETSESETKIIQKSKKGDSNTDKSPAVLTQESKIREENIKTDENKSSDTTPEKNRAKRRREKVKQIRLVAKEKFKKLVSDVESGNEEAIALIKSKVSELEQKPTLSRSSEKKLKTFRKILRNCGITENNPTKKQKQNANKTEKPSLKGKEKKTNQKHEAKKSNLIQQNISSETEDSDEDDKDEAVNLNQNQLEDNSEDAEEEQEKEVDSDDSEDEEVDGEEIENQEEGDSEEQTDESVGDEDKSDVENENSNESSSDEEDVNINNKQKDVTAKKSLQAKLPVKEADKTLSSVIKGQSRYVVFVGNLPFDVTKQEISEHFVKIGKVKDVRIPLDKQTNKCRGFAYVEVADQTCYEKALSLHHTFIKGRRINVLYSQGGKKKGEEKKKEIKSKNFKLQAMRQEGKLGGSIKQSHKRSFRRAKQRTNKAKE